MHDINWRNLSSTVKLKQLALLLSFVLLVALLPSSALALPHIQALNETENTKTNSTNIIRVPEITVTDAERNITITMVDGIIIRTTPSVRNVIGSLMGEDENEEDSLMSTTTTATPSSSTQTHIPQITNIIIIEDKHTNTEEEEETEDLWGLGPQYDLTYGPDDDDDDDNFYNRGRFRFRFRDPYYYEDDD